MVFVGLTVAISAFSWSAVKNRDTKISSLNNELSKTKTELQNEQSKLDKILYAVHPEQEYETYRKEAYMELYRQTFPGADGDNGNFALVRVFHTSAFRDADNFFKKIDNDDIVLYQNRNIKDTKDGTPLAIVRPREKRVIASGNLAFNIIEKARSGNHSRSMFGEPLNLYSEQ